MNLLPLILGHTNLALAAVNFLLALVLCWTGNWKQGTVNLLVGWLCWGIGALCLSSAKKF